MRAPGHKSVVLAVAVTLFGCGTSDSRGATSTTARVAAAQERTERTVLRWNENEVNIDAFVLSDAEFATQRDPVAVRDPGVVVGPLAREHIVPVLRENFPARAACINELPGHGETLNDRGSLVFEIDALGVVSNVVVRGLGVARVESCIADVMRRSRFPRSDKAIHVTWPIILDFVAGDDSTN